MAEQEFDARVRLCLSASEVVPVLRWEYGPWVSSLSTEETRAIRKYSYNSYEGGPHKFYRRLNSMLRGEYRGKMSKCWRIIQPPCRPPLQSTLWSMISSAIVDLLGPFRSITKGEKCSTRNLSVHLS